MKAGNWIKGGIAVALMVGGSLLAWPGETGRHSAGMIILIAGLFCASELLGARVRRMDKERKGEE